MDMIGKRSLFSHDFFCLLLLMQLKIHHLCTIVLVYLILLTLNMWRVNHMTPKKHLFDFQRCTWHTKTVGVSVATSLNKHAPSGIIGSSNQKNNKQTTNQQQKPNNQKFTPSGNRSQTKKKQQPTNLPTQNQFFGNNNWHLETPQRRGVGFQDFHGVTLKS